MPLGFVLAILFWSIPIVTIFPPGALTVVPLQHNLTSPLPVPFYNCSYTGVDGAVDWDLRTDLASISLFQERVDVTVENLDLQAGNSSISSQVIGIYNG